MLVLALNGDHLTNITHKTTLVSLSMSGNHHELIYLFIFDAPSTPSCIGPPLIETPLSSYWPCHIVCCCGGENEGPGCRYPNENLIYFKIQTKSMAEPEYQKTWQNKTWLWLWKPDKTIDGNVDKPDIAWMTVRIWQRAWTNLETKYRGGWLVSECSWWEWTQVKGMKQMAKQEGLRKKVS